MNQLNDVEHPTAASVASYKAKHANVFSTHINFSHPQSLNVDESWLSFAASCGHLKLVIWMVETYGVNPKVKNNWIISRAAEQGSILVVIYLVGHGCDPTTYSNFAVRHALVRGYLPLARFLIEYGCDAGDSDGHAITDSAYWGELSSVKLIIENCETHRDYIQKAMNYAVEEVRPITAKYLRRVLNPKKIDSRLGVIMSDKFEIFVGAIRDLMEMIEVR
jgi:hypothetical protein